jgi:hypothetical protein
MARTQKNLPEYMTWVVVSVAIIAVVLLTTVAVSVWRRRSLDPE